MGCYRPDTGKSGMRITQIGKTNKLSREAPVIICLLRSAAQVSSIESVLTFDGTNTKHKHKI